MITTRIRPSSDHKSDYKGQERFPSNSIYLALAMHQPTPDYKR